MEKRLAMAGAAGMSAARTFGMAGGTGLAAVVLPRFLDRFAGIDNAQARVTGTFHLSNSCHGNLLSR